MSRYWFYICIILGFVVTLTNTYVGPSLFLVILYIATLILAPAFIKSRLLVSVCIACGCIYAATYVDILSMSKVTVTGFAHPTVVCQECPQ